MKKTRAVTVWIVNMGKVINTKRKVLEVLLYRNNIYTVVSDIVSNEAAQIFTSCDPWFKGIVN